MKVVRDAVLLFALASGLALAQGDMWPFRKRIFTAETLRRREEQNSKPEGAEVAEDAEGRLAHCERPHKIGRFTRNHRVARGFCPSVIQELGTILVWNDLSIY
jgi:hypothetical protein